MRCVDCKWHRKTMDIVAQGTTGTVHLCVQPDRAGELEWDDAYTDQGVCAEYKRKWWKIWIK